MRRHRWRWRRRRQQNRLDNKTQKFTGRCIHTCRHTSVHPYIQYPIHQYTNTSIHTYMHPYIHRSIHPYIHTQLHTYILQPRPICSEEKLTMNRYILSSSLRELGGRGGGLQITCALQQAEVHFIFLGPSGTQGLINTPKTAHNQLLINLSPVQCCLMGSAFWCECSPGLS